MASQFPPLSVRLHLSQGSMELNEKEALREVTDDHQIWHATKMPETCHFPTTGALFSCPTEAGERAISRFSCPTLQWGALSPTVL